MRQLLKRRDFLRRIYYRMQLRRVGGQDGAGGLVAELASKGPKTFVEFGFDPTEFNCIGLAKDPGWRGLLIDSSFRKVGDVRRLFHSGIKAEQAFLTLDNLNIVRDAFPKIGVLSIDVDGNDYWFLKALIDVRPTLIAVRSEEHTSELQSRRD